MLLEESRGVFWWGTHTKIMSYLGAFIYELGLLGAVFIIYYVVAIQNGTIKRLLETFFLICLLSTAISVASPIISFLLAHILFMQYWNGRAQSEIFLGGELKV